MWSDTCAGHGGVSGSAWGAGSLNSPLCRSLGLRLPCRHRHQVVTAQLVGKGRDALVFTTPGGDVLRVSNYRKRFFAPAVAACQKADDSFPAIGPHDLRHTAVSLAVSAGTNLKAVSGCSDTPRRR